MRVFALIAERIPGHRSFALEDRYRVQRFDNCPSFIFVDRTADYPLPDCVFCIFNAAGENIGVRFEDSSFEQFHPFITYIHGRVLSGNWKKGTSGDSPAMVVRRNVNSTN